MIVIVITIVLVIVIIVIKMSDVNTISPRRPAEPSALWLAKSAKLLVASH